MHYLHKVMLSPRLTPPLKRRGFVITLASGIATPMAYGKPTAIRVAAASDLKFVLTALCNNFTQTTGQAVDLQFGSSGNLARQITQGLPLDIFMSADEALVFSLFDSGLTPDKGALYGTGRIALILSKGFSKNSALQLPKTGSDANSEAKTSLKTQLQPIRKFAIANPEHAPYGRAAKEALQNLGLWEHLSPKLVLGDNISQATQFVTSGAAQAGITALSLALAQDVATQSGAFWIIPANLHAPLKQRMVLLKTAQPAAKALYAYLQTPAARAVFEKYGFGV